MEVATQLPAARKEMAADGRTIEEASKVDTIVQLHKVQDQLHKEPL